MKPFFSPSLQDINVPDMVVPMFSRAVIRIPARKKQLKPFRVTANHTLPRPKVSADNQTKLLGVSKQACSMCFEHFDKCFRY
jgi:hypothetical protein